MSSVSISILESKKADYQRRLTSARNSLQSNEADYESLVEFKGKVQRSQESFYTISTREAELLAAVRPYYDYNKCAKSFSDTMTRFLDGIGTRIANFAYSALIRMISAQVTRTFNKIEDLNDEILRYRDAINDIDAEITYQKSLEVQV